MAEKKSFLNWVGFTGEGESTNQPSSVDRIRELEAQIADLKSRRDITGLTKEEFEILATETAMSMIKSAQARESKAQAAASRLVAETTRATKEELEAEGLLAVCIQHEMDHLLGKVFVEYLSSLKRNRIKIKMKKRAKEHLVNA